MFRHSLVAMTLPLLILFLGCDNLQNNEISENPFVGKWNFFEQVSLDGEDATRESVGFDIYLENGFYIHCICLQFRIPLNGKILGKGCIKILPHSTI